MIPKDNDSDLDIAFAKVLWQSKTLSQYQLARQFADEANKRLQQLIHAHHDCNDTRDEVAFLSCEVDAWNLIATLKQLSDTQWNASCDATMKTFIEGLRQDATPLYTTTEEEEMAAEVEMEIREIIRKNKVAGEFPVENTRTKRRRLSIDDGDDFEKLNERLFKCLRMGKTAEAIEVSHEEDEPWRTALLNQYATIMQSVTDETPLLWSKQEKESWNNTCEHLARQPGLGPYGKALFGLFRGQLEMVLPVCSTWEDVVWAYYATKLARIPDDGHDNLVVATSELQTREGDSQIDAETLALARSKDGIILRNGPAKFFHFVQSMVLSHDINQLYSYLAKALTSSSYLSEMDLCNSPKLLECVLRFTSALILYSQHTNASLSKDMVVIIKHYVQLGSMATTSRIGVLVLYTSHLSPSQQKQIIAAHWSSRHWSSNEQKTIINTSKRYGLPLKPILKMVTSKILEEGRKEYMQEQANEKVTKPGYYAADDVSDAVIHCISALEWLLMDVKLYGEAIAVANNLMRLFLTTGDDFLASTVLGMISEQVLNEAALETEDALEVAGQLQEFKKQEELITAMNE